MVTLLNAMGALLVAIVGGVLLNPDEERYEERKLLPLERATAARPFRAPKRGPNPSAPQAPSGS